MLRTLQQRLYLEHSAVTTVLHVSCPGKESTLIKYMVAFNPAQFVDMKQPSSIEIFVRVGDRLLVNADYQELFATSAKEVFSFDPAIHRMNMANRAHAALTLSIFPHVPFENATVLDLGAGYGTLSLDALLRGAKRVIPVDNDPNMEQAFKRYFEMNGYLDNVAFLPLDITCPTFPQSLPLEDIEVVLSNIGEGQYKGNPNRIAVELVAMLPRAKYFVGGGYALKDEHDATRDIHALAKYGFRVTSRFILEGKDVIDKNIAFIAER